MTRLSLNPRPKPPEKFSQVYNPQLKGGRDIYKRHHYAGRGGPAGFAMAAVNVALWDLKGNRLGTPLWRLLGGANPSVRAYAGNIDLNFPVDRLLEGGMASVERGFRSVKMRLGRPTIAEAHGLPVMSHGAHDLHIHVLAAAPNAAYLEWHTFGLDTFMENPLTVEDGYACAPDRPGHGIVLDWHALVAHRVS